MSNPASLPTVFPSRKHYTSPEFHHLHRDAQAVAAKLFGRMTIHVLGLPHTKTSKEYATCAFTQKVVKLCAMMHRRGHHVIHYGAEGADVECSEHVSVVSHAEWSEYYSNPGTGFYDITEEGRNAPFLKLWSERLHASLRARVGKDFTEIVAMTWGGPQRNAVMGINQFQVESGIGYPHSWADYRVYESYAWMHMHMGTGNHYDGKKWYWSVIPNAFDVTEFDLPAPGARGDDFLYLGRIIDAKGVGIAIHVARELGKKITIVGQGDPTWLLEQPNNAHVRYLPPVGADMRKKLLSEAKAVFCPSFYVEPFCGTHIEAQMCGTPVITTDWGVFPEGVLHGLTGFRCRNFEQFVWAAANVDKLSERACRDWAVENFSLERVALMYEEYFQSVLNIHHKLGFYLPNPNRVQLDWLTKSTPAIAPVNLYIEHRPPPEPPPEPTGWAVDQQWERNWWGLNWAPHWDEEIKKQQTYFRLMGMPTPDAEGIRDFGDKCILDVGCGPVSLLQRSKHGPSIGIDPLAVSEETLDRYEQNDVEFLNVKAEQIETLDRFDEVWIYNCLQHTDDPIEILRRVAIVGKAVRLFEWIDTGVHPGHPQNLTEDMFVKAFPTSDWEIQIWNTGVVRDVGGSAEGKYCALYITKR